MVRGGAWVPPTKRSSGPVLQCWWQRSSDPDHGLVGRGSGGEGGWEIGEKHDSCKSCGYCLSLYI